MNEGINHQRISGGHSGNKIKWTGTFHRTLDGSFMHHLGHWDGLTLEYSRPLWQSELEVITHTDNQSLLDWEYRWGGGGRTKVSATTIRHCVLSWVECRKLSTDCHVFQPHPSRQSSSSLPFYCVQSLMLSSHIFLGLPRLLFPSTVSSLWCYPATSF